MKNHGVSTLTCLLMLTLLCCGGPGEVEDKRPNIIMIMADDMGYSDISPYGGEIDTPSLQRLADNGLRFTRYHTNNMCVPTRGSLMTGLFSNLAIVKGQGVSKDAVLLPELLHQAGYSTFMSGKWHLGELDDQENWPLQRGFERYYGTITGAGSFFTPATLKRGNENAESEWLDPDYYYTDAITDSALDYLGEGIERDKPFFLYVAYTAAHWPLHAREEDIARYKGKYAMGWDELRKQRHARMKELGVVNPDWELSPRNPKVPAWDKEKHKEWQERRMEVYAAQVDRMDAGIGRIVKAVEEAGELENTLIVFQVDNGGCHVEYPPDRKGIYLPKKTRDGTPVRPGNLPDIMPGPEDTYQSYGHGWANASNTPFRLFKQHDHQGGIMTPLIVHWPKVIRQGGQITDQVAHVVDLMPTFLEAANVRHPRSFNGKRVMRIDGKSLIPVFDGERRRAHDALFWRWSHGSAVRRDKWKLVRVDEEPWELYDIEADGTELNDLSKENPLVVQQLEALWNAWDARTPEQVMR